MAERGAPSLSTQIEDLASRPWYETCRAFRKFLELRSVAKGIDEELKWRYEQDRAMLAPHRTYSFPRTDYGRVSWSLAYGKYQFRPPHYVANDGETPVDEGFVIPASANVLPHLPHDIIPIHLTLLDGVAIDERDEGYEVFEGTDGHETAIYFVQAALSGLVKIGIASHLESRVASIQTGSPEPVGLLASMPGNKYLERFLHGMFEPIHSHGEWFYPHWSLYSVMWGITRP